jgi:formate dehydrogenase major subunit
MVQERRHRRVAITTARASVVPRASLELTRRDLFGSAVGGALALGFHVPAARVEMRRLKIARTTETRSTCPYCSVSCGVILHTLGDGARNATPAIVHVEGDPDHPINRGTLCPKGITLKENIASEHRLRRPRVRRPGSSQWEELSWDEAIARIARHVKDTRDRCFVSRNARGEVVNRNPGIGLIGGCTDTNEFNYLQWKVVTALGVPYRDTQARV